MNEDRKSKWVQERCTDKFEGRPCDYPNCRCSLLNQQTMERDWVEYIAVQSRIEHPARINQ